MRMTHHICFATLAVFLCLGHAVASEGKVQPGNAGSTVFIPGGALSGSTLGPGAGVYMTGFEPSQGFAPGFVHGQAGWVTFGGPGSSSLQPRISALNPIHGMQSLRAAHDQLVIPSALIGAFSPNVGPVPVGPTQFSVDVAIHDGGGSSVNADYYVVPQSPGYGLVATRVAFSYVGFIYVLDDLAGTPTWVNTGTQWALNVPVNLTIMIDPGADTIDYYYGGQHIYSSVGGVYAAPVVEEAVLYSDNFHLLDYADFDNLYFGPPQDTLALEPEQGCVTTGELVVLVNLTNPTQFIVGGQFFLEYDNTVLDFVSIEPAGMSDLLNPFSLEVYANVDETAGTIDYAVGVEGGGPGTNAPATMAIIRFNAPADICEAWGLVKFRLHYPPTRVTNIAGAPLTTLTVDLGQVVLDSTPPVISPPADVTIECDQPTAPGGSGPPAATAADNCGAPSLAYADTVFAGPCEYSYTISRVWTATDSCGLTDTHTQIITVEDSTPPVISGMPSNITVYAEAGFCSAVVSWIEPTAVDNCGDVFISSTHQPGDVFPAGATTVTYTFADDCGNEVQADFTVTVLGVSEMAVDVELLQVFVNVTRCITFTFETSGGPVTVSTEIAFTSTPPDSAIGSAVILVPCEFSCMTARDVLHTLARQHDPVVSGTEYVASFTGSGSGGKGLIGGNLNDDEYIDVLDFGVFISQYNVNYGTGNTTCATPYPHGDISGDGLVTAADFTFIQLNFLTFSEVCPARALLLGHARDRTKTLFASRRGPVTSITVAELHRLGLGALAIADLNGDQMLDAQDIAAFLSGSHP
ncbi:MAG TPA: HYR domain-containing protein [Phycisphaerales bacterium]|nr:HYR domain-containing protein [Phycisphaerales bacterium]HRQ74487.1 HYR domain-containing protein [Phycisphaerales bacterium]